MQCKGLQLSDPDIPKTRWIPVVLQLNGAPAVGLRFWLAYVGSSTLNLRVILDQYAVMNDRNVGGN